jgi:hypothetical protein
MLIATGSLQISCSAYIISDGIGLLGGTTNHFVTCDDPPKVGGSSLPAIQIAC